MLDDLTKTGVTGEHHVLCVDSEGLQSSGRVHSEADGESGRVHSAASGESVRQVIESGLQYILSALSHDSDFEAALKIPGPGVANR